MDGRLVFIFSQMAINAVVTRIDLTADKPFPAGRIAGVQSRMPVFIPIEQIGVFFETVGEIIQAKAVIDAGIGHVGLGNKFRAGVKVLFFAPMYRNFGFRCFNNFFFRHTVPFLCIFCLNSLFYLR